MRTAVAALGLVGGAAAFRSYPLFKQCDPAWGNDEMGTTGNGERSNICGEGCAMSSTSMALNGLGITIDGISANPQSLNAWLERTPGGYLCAGGDCNNLNLTIISNVPGAATAPHLELIGELPKPSVADIQAGLTAGDTVYIAHVHNNGHFVLLTGFTDDMSFTVNDPFYASTSYPYSNISDIIMYKVVPAATEAPAPAPVAPEHSKPSRLRARLGRVHKQAKQANAKAQRPAVSAAALRSASPDVAVTSPIIPYTYPLYKQCDPAWANDLMVTDTICQVGCLMSSTSMAIGRNNISISNATADPATLNAFLRTHSGYVGDNDMDEAVVPVVNPSHIQWSDATGMHTKNDIPIATIQSLLRSGAPVIANVMQGGHFVLVTGWDSANPDTLMVNDPGFDRATYSYSGDVVGWRLFTMQPCAKGC